MPTPTYVALATTTLSGTASDVTFSSIPATYRDLVLVINGSRSGGDRFGIQFNSSTSSYSDVYMLGTGAAAASGVQGATYGSIGSYLGSTDSVIVVSIFDYSSSDKHTSYLSRAGAGAFSAEAWAGRWGNTSVVTSVNVYTPSGLLQTGTSLSLYGIEA